MTIRRRLRQTCMDLIGLQCPAFLSLPPPLNAGIGQATVSPKPTFGRLLVSTKRRSFLRPTPAVRPPPSDGRPKNRFLASLSDADFRRLQPFLTTVPIRLKQVLQKNGEPVESVYFLNGGVASITTVLSDGTTVEAATVGDEGMLGLEAFLDEDAVAPGETLMQVPDTDAVILS